MEVATDLIEVPLFLARVADDRGGCDCGRGVLRMQGPNGEFPVLILVFREDHAVVHLMSDTERMSLLVGDGTVPSGAEVEVPITDDLAAFTGDFVLDIDRAWDLVHDFTQARAAGPLGEWREL